jgi:hypothetical protein
MGEVVEFKYYQKEKFLGWEEGITGLRNYVCFVPKAEMFLSVRCAGFL